MSRKFCVGGNWKMNGDKATIDGIIDFLAKGDLPGDVGVFSGHLSFHLEDVGIFGPFTRYRSHILIA
jgi:triosephosphate isomerase